MSGDGQNLEIHGHLGCSPYPDYFQTLHHRGTGCAPNPEVPGHVISHQSVKSGHEPGVKIDHESGMKIDHGPGMKIDHALAVKLDHMPGVAYDPVPGVKDDHVLENKEPGMALLFPGAEVFDVG